MITNLGGAYDNSDGGILTAIFYTGAGGTGSIVSTQTWADGGADGDTGDIGQADAYFGYSGSNFLSIILDVQRDGNSGNGGTGLDDLGFGVAVPEPSTYALLAGFIALGGVMLRRRLKS